MMSKHNTLGTALALCGTLALSGCTQTPERATPVPAQSPELESRMLAIGPGPNGFSSPLGGGINEAVDGGIPTGQTCVSGNVAVDCTYSTNFVATYASTREQVKRKIEQAWKADLNLAAILALVVGEPSAAGATQLLNDFTGGFATDVEAQFESSEQQTVLTIVARVDGGKLSLSNNTGTARCSELEPFENFYQFSQECGTKYVSDKVYGGVLVMGLNVTNITDEDKVKIGIDGNAEAFSSKSNIQNALQSIRSVTGNTFTVTVRNAGLPPIPSSVLGEDNTIELGHLIAYVGAIQSNLTNSCNAYAASVANSDPSDDLPTSSLGFEIDWDFKRYLPINFSSCGLDGTFTHQAYQCYQEVYRNVNNPNGDAITGILMDMDDILATDNDHPDWVIWGTESGTSEQDIRDEFEAFRGEVQDCRDNFDTLTETCSDAVAQACAEAGENGEQCRDVLCGQGTWSQNVNGNGEGGGGSSGQVNSMDDRESTGACQLLDTCDAQSLGARYRSKYRPSVQVVTRENPGFTGGEYVRYDAPTDTSINGRDPATSICLTSEIRGAFDGPSEVARLYVDNTSSSPSFRVQVDTSKSRNRDLNSLTTFCTSASNVFFDPGVSWDGSDNAAIGGNPVSFGNPLSFPVGPTTKAAALAGIEGAFDSQDEFATVFKPQTGNDWDITVDSAIGWIAGYALSFGGDGTHDAFIGSPTSAGTN